MFAGPNGSGKTTIKRELGRPPEWFGIYINPDDLERTIRETRSLPLDSFEMTISTEEIQRFFLSSEFLRSHHLSTAASAIEVREDAIPVVKHVADLQACGVSEAGPERPSSP